MKNSRLVIDTNEFIFTFGVGKNGSSDVLLNKLAELFPNISIHIPRTIVDEVRNNLTTSKFKEFILFIQSVGNIDEDIFVPYELGEKYAAMGLKPADALIAAYTEWINADILVSENRHFLSRQTNLPFKILSAEKTLKLLKK